MRTMWKSGSQVEGWTCDCSFQYWADTLGTIGSTLSLERRQTRMTEMTESEVSAVASSAANRLKTVRVVVSRLDRSEPKDKMEN